MIPGVSRVLPGDGPALPWPPSDSEVSHSAPCTDGKVAVLVKMKITHLIKWKNNPLITLAPSVLRRPFQVGISGQGTLATKLN